MILKNYIYSFKKIKELYIYIGHRAISIVMIGLLIPGLLKRIIYIILQLLLHHSSYQVQQTMAF